MSSMPYGQRVLLPALRKVIIAGSLTFYQIQHIMRCRISDDGPAGHHMALTIQSTVHPVASKAKTLGSVALTLSVPSFVFVGGMEDSLLAWKLDTLS